MMITSTPPSISPRAWTSNWSRRSAKRICPSDGNLVPGPIEPATKRGWSAVEKLSATSRAMRAPARLISWARAAMAVLAEGGRERPEGAGLDDVDADVEERRVELLDDVRPGDHEQLVAPLEVRAAEVVGGEVLLLDAGAEGAVVDDHALANRFEERAHAGRLVGSVLGPTSVRPSRRRSGDPGSNERATIDDDHPMKIYTRKGDDGTTGLLYGGRVPKDGVAPSAYGGVDEAQAAIGVARAETRPIPATAPASWARSSSASSATCGC